MIRQEDRQKIADEARKKTVKQVARENRVGTTSVYSILREFGIKPLRIRDLFRKENR